VVGVAGKVREQMAAKLVDFRKGGERFVALVHEEMPADPFSGAVYVIWARRSSHLWR